MTTKKAASEIKRNLAIVNDLRNAKAVRVAYKTADGWKRLRLPSKVVPSLKRGAISVVDARLAKLFPIVVEAAVDKAVAELVGEINA